MKRTLALKKDTLTQLTGADLAAVAGGALPPPTLYTCPMECIVTPLVGELPSLDTPCS